MESRRDFFVAQLVFFNVLCMLHVLCFCIEFSFTQCLYQEENLFIQPSGCTCILDSHRTVLHEIMPGPGGCFKRIKSFMMLHDSNLFYNSVPRHPSTNGCMVNYKQRRQEAMSVWNAPRCKLHRDQRANATATNAPICKSRNARPRTQHFSATLFSTALYKTLPQHFATTLFHTSVQLFSTANTSLQHSTPQNHRDTTTAQNHHH